MTPNTKEVIQFDVGGTKYKASRSLIEQYPNTMLARLISDTWQKNPEEEIFLDRSGFRFQFVLDFMRDKKVCLPMSIPKPSMLQELEYFGFDNVTSETINESHSCFEAATLVAEFSKRHEEFLKDCTNKFNEIEKEKVYEIVAFEYFKHYTLTGSLTDFNFWYENHPHFEEMKRHGGSWTDVTLLDKCLLKYGLQCYSGPRTCYDRYRLHNVDRFTLRALVDTT